MASGHHRKPVTIIEMHQTHPENLPLPVLPPPLHPLYLALFFSSLLQLLSWYSLVVICLDSLLPAALQVSFSSPAFCPPCTAEAFSDRTRSEPHSNQRKYNIGTFFYVLSVLKCIISNINWDQGRQCFKCTFLMHVPVLIVKDSSLHIIPSSKIVCLGKKQKQTRGLIIFWYVMHIFTIQSIPHEFPKSCPTFFLKSALKFNQ